MSELDTTVVSDNEKIRLRNLTKNTAVYITPATNIRREIPPLGYIWVPASEVRECSYDRGCSVLLRDYVQVCNWELAQELGVPPDTVEYDWDDKKVTEAVTTADMDVLLDALDFAPAGIKQAIVDKAVELEIPDIRRRKAIEEAMRVNVDSMIRNKQYANTTSTQKTAQRRRVKTQSGGEATKKRRSTAKAAE